MGRFGLSCILFLAISVASVDETETHVDLDDSDEVRMMLRRLKTKDIDTDELDTMIGGKSNDEDLMRRLRSKRRLTVVLPEGALEKKPSWEVDPLHLGRYSRKEVDIDNMFKLLEGMTFNLKKVQNKADTFELTLIDREVKVFDKEVTLVEDTTTAFQGKEAQLISRTHGVFRLRMPFYVDAKENWHGAYCEELDTSDVKCMTQGFELDVFDDMFEIRTQGHDSQFGAVHGFNRNYRLLPNYTHVGGKDMTEIEGQLVAQPSPKQCLNAIWWLTQPVLMKTGSYKPRIMEKGQDRSFTARLPDGQFFEATNAEDKKAFADQTWLVSISNFHFADFDKKAGNSDDAVMMIPFNRWENIELRYETPYLKSCKADWFVFEESKPDLKPACIYTETDGQFFYKNTNREQKPTGACKKGLKITDNNGFSIIRDVAVVKRPKEESLIAKLITKAQRKEARSASKKSKDKKKKGRDSLLDGGKGAKEEKRRQDKKKSMERRKNRDKKKRGRGRGRGRNRGRKKRGRKKRGRKKRGRKKRGRKKRGRKRRGRRKLF